MIGIVVPAHNAQKHIEDCLQSIFKAAAHPNLANESFEIIVVLDACEDRTGALARSLGVRTIDVHAQSADMARHAGARLAIASGIRWLAFIDADSVVAPDWLAVQLAFGADAVCESSAPIGNCGTGSTDWQTSSLGMSAPAYVAAARILNSVTGKTASWVDALLASGARIACFEGTEIGREGTRRSSLTVAEGRLIPAHSGERDRLSS